MRLSSWSDNAPLDLAAISLQVEQEEDGCILLRQSDAVGDNVPRSLGEWLGRPNRNPPDRTALIAAGGAGRAVQRLSQVDAMRMAEGTAQCLLDSGLGETRPLMVFARGGVEAFILILGGYLAGVPVMLADTALLDRKLDGERLARLVAQTAPGMIHCADPVAAQPAFAMLQLDRTIRLTGGADDFARIIAHPPSEELAAARQRLHPDRIARIQMEERPGQPDRLIAFSHRALARQAQALAAVWPFLAMPGCAGLALPKDWSQAQTGLVLLHLALMRGVPVHCGHARRAVRDQATILAAAPDDFLDWADAPDADLRLASADALIALGGAIPPDAADRLSRIALAARGDVPPMLALWGPAEAGGAAFAVHWLAAAEGSIGLPLPGFAARLVPSAATGLYALDLAGPGLGAGIWRGDGVDPFPLDSDGFLETKPALEAVRASDWSQGLRSAGRFA